MIQPIFYFLRKLTIGTVCCLILSGGLTDMAGANDQTPEQAVKAFLETLGSMEFPVTNFTRHAELVEQANAYLDVETMGSQALIDHWPTVSNEDRNAFFDLLWKLIENVAYPKNQNLMGKEQIIYGKTIEAGNGFQVPVTVKPEDDEAPTVSMSYHLSEKAGHWKIDDVVLDDVSIIEDLKYQFNKIITESKFPGLLDKMRKRLAEAEEKNKIEKT